MKNKTLLFICAMWLAVACKPHTPPPAPEDPPSQAIPAPTDPPTQESISPPSAETNPPTRSAPSDSANQEETLLNQESVSPSSPEPEIIPESTSPGQTTNPLQTPESQPIPRMPDTNPPAPESAPQVVAPPTAPAPRPRPTPSLPIAVSIKDPFLLPAVYEKIRRLERPKTSIALSYMLIPTSKLASFRANPQRFAPTLSTWRRGGIFGATNFLNISRSHSNIRGSNSNYFLQNSKVPSDYFYRSHLRLIRFDFTNRNAPTLSYKHFYSANDINNVTDAPLRRASFEKSFDEPWSLQDSDVRYLNGAFPHLAVHAGETFHLLLLLSFHEPSTKLAPYYFYDHPVNLDNLDQFVYTMQD